MTILQTKYNISPEGYNKRTPRKLKLIADIALGASFLFDILNMIPFTEMPEFPGKEWVVWSILPIATLFKFATKFVYETTLPEAK